MKGELRTLDTIFIIGFAVVTTTLAVVVVTGAGVVVGACVVVVMVMGGMVVMSKNVMGGRVTGAAVLSNSLRGAMVFTTTVVSGGEVVVGAGVVVVTTVVITAGEGVTNWGRETMASSTTSLPSLSFSIIAIIFLISIMWGASVVRLIPPSSVKMRSGSERILTNLAGSSDSGRAFLPGWCSLVRGLKKVGAKRDSEFTVTAELIAGLCWNLWTTGELVG